MKLSRIVPCAVAVSFFILIANLRLSNVAAQTSGEPSQEAVLNLQVTANDEISASNVSAHYVHLRPLRSAVSHRELFAVPGMRNRKAHPRSSASASAASSVSSASVPSVPAPGFYPADLSNLGGQVLTATQSNNVYVNCAPSCWGTPSTFLTHLGLSNFIHVT